MSGAVEISLLGPPSVRRGGKPVSFDTAKAIALLAHLALSDRSRSRAALCELLWPGRDSEHARSALRRTLSVLRKALGEEWIETAGDSVALHDGSALNVDVQRFRSLNRPHASADDLLAAVELFRGEFLEGFGLRDSPEFDHWCLAEADLLRRELGAALARLIRLLGERAEYQTAIAHARRWLALDQLHEPAHRELIRLYALNGDRAAALSQYRQCVRTLSQELGVAPVAETAALFEQVSEGTLVAPTPARASVRHGRVLHAAEPKELPLVGRAEEVAALVAAHRAAGPDGRLALIEGEAGIGKSRLAHELMVIVQSDGARVLTSRCHDDEAGLPYGPVIGLLEQAARTNPERLASAVPPQRLIDASLLAPELATFAPERGTLEFTGPAARTRLLEAVVEVIAAACKAPVSGLVFVDDVHTADEATLDVLAYIGRRLRERALLLTLAWRSEAIPPGHRLRRLAAELARAGTATVVTLGRLSEPEVSSLTRSVTGEVREQLERQIYIESEGLPLFVAEYLAALESGEEPTEGLLPGEMRDLLAARIGGLGAVAHQLLEAGATIGRSFELETVRLASGRGDEETVEGLEELMGRGLIRELALDEPAYDFTHGKLRALVYEEIGRARRRLLHGRVATALLRGTEGREGAALAAQHLQLAGDHAGAAEHHVRAADHAASVLAHRDALAHLDAALDLGFPDVLGLRERIGDLRTLVGDYAGAISSYEAAAAECEPCDLPRIEHKLGGVHQRRGEWKRAEARFAVALEAVSDQDVGLRARILADLSLTTCHAGDHAHALALADDSLALADAVGDEPAQAQAHNLLGALARERGDLDAARSQLQESLALAEALPDLSARTAALNNLALLARDEGDLPRALQLTEDALRLCEVQGDRHRQAALENNLADLHHEAGRRDDSMAHLRRAVTIFSEIGGDDSTRLPEIWKLVSW